MYKSYQNNIMIITKSRDKSRIIITKQSHVYVTYIQNVPFIGNNHIHKIIKKNYVSILYNIYLSN